MPDYARMEKPVENNRAEHLALTLVLDVSGSMSVPTANGKTPNQLLNEGVNQMIAELSKDKRLSEIVDLSIITFGERGREEVYQAFAPIGTVEPISLYADQNETYAADAITMAIENTRARVKLYRNGAWKPWIVFMTDGYLHDDISQVAARVRQREKEGKIRMFCLGVGDGYDPVQLKLLSDNALALNDYKLHEFFSWLGRSVAVVSQSVPGAQVTLPTNDDPNKPGQPIFGWVLNS
jgi:uncharacterized protein YegL